MNTHRVVLLASITIAALTACQTPPPNAAFGIRLKSNRSDGQTTLLITGSGFTPQGRVTINIFGFPRRGDIGPYFTTAKANGDIEWNMSFTWRFVSRDQELPNIRVTVRDDVSGRALADDTSAEPFVDRFR